MARLVVCGVVTLCLCVASTHAFAPQRQSRNRPLLASPEQELEMLQERLSSIDDDLNNGDGNSDTVELQAQKEAIEKKMEVLAEELVQLW
eukprot:CAMPEP_0198109370 /NCGR_PEP_ID=MMETSP1442-20131203/1404_1 /TAXON_ID= /ORGANISM="Craspedostauros australis, Strain CCMP3328" /LENGTH=89 /DNA_ID=CAMNT_0043764993 /DNA_START=275 /DNA_END=541 /DNA_ORIENTATION=+